MQVLHYEAPPCAIQPNPEEWQAKRVLKLNRRLETELGSESGLGRYRWIWSEDDLLTSPMVLVDDDKNVRLDYVCGCGRNVWVHMPGCKTLTVPLPRCAVRKVAPDLINQWVLCRWVEPPPPHLWIFDEPYPRHGQYTPYSDGTKTIALAMNTPPTLELTVQIIALQKERDTWTEQQVRDRQMAALARGEARRKENLYHRVRDLVPVHEGFPGKKENWSAGGIGNSPRLNLEVVH